MTNESTTVAAADQSGGTSPAAPEASPCCGTVAEAQAEGRCCGSAAKEQAVAAGAGCC